VARLERAEGEKFKIPMRWVLAGAALLAIALVGYGIWSRSVRNPGWDLTDEPPLYGVASVDEILAADYMDLKQRAEWGNAQAQYAMGVRWAYGEKYVRRGDLEGMANADIEAQSKEYFSLSARQGYPPALTVLAVEDAYPVLARRGSTEEPRRLRDAAAKDYPPAWYLRGLWAVRTADRLEDSAQASVLRHEGLLGIERAAQAGHAPAEHWTAIAHWCGLHGFDRDEGAAVEWMTRAATHGSPEAQEQVVELYLKRTSEPSPVEAQAWSLATGAGDTGARFGLTEIQARHAELRSAELRDTLLPPVGPLPTPGRVPWPRLDDLDCPGAPRGSETTPPRTEERTAYEQSSGDPSLVERKRVARDTVCDQRCVTAWIGPDGGEVSLPDGTALVYAPGEVSQLVEVTLQPLSPMRWEAPGHATPVGTAVWVHQLTDETPRASIRVPAPPDRQRLRARDFVMVQGEMVPTGGMSEDGTLWDGVKFEGQAAHAATLRDGQVSFHHRELPDRVHQVFLAADPDRVFESMGLESGYVTLNCKPWCRVRLDGEYVRNSPIKNYAVAPGPHHVELECGRCSTPQTIEHSFTVEAGETYTSVRNEFEP